MLRGRTSVLNKPQHNTQPQRARRGAHRHQPKEAPVPLLALIHRSLPYIAYRTIFRLLALLIVSPAHGPQP